MHQKHVNSNLFSLVLEIVDICPRDTFCCIRQDTCPSRLVNHQILYETQCGYTGEGAFPASSEACVESTGTRIYPR